MHTAAQISTKRPALYGAVMFYATLVKRKPGVQNDDQIKLFVLKQSKTFLH